MTGWEIKDLISELKISVKAEDSVLNQFILDYQPLCSMTSTRLVILRQFKVNLWQDERRVMNAPPEEDNETQWGITVVSHDGASGMMFSACLPNQFDYQGVVLDENEQITIITKEQTIITNVKEVARKLKSIYGLATEAEIAASVDRLSNEQYAPPEKPEVVYQILNDEILGSVTFDPQTDRYEAIYQIDGRSVDIYIELVEAKALLTLVGNAAKKLSSQYYLQAMQAMLIPMLALKNDYWLGEDEDEDGNKEPILDAEEFKRRITITGIEFYANGESVIYCDDGELFFGHCIMIDLDKDGVFIDANIAG